MLNEIRNRVSASGWSALGRFVIGALVLLLCCNEVNQVSAQIKSGYGRTKGSDYRTSVNGTSVLAELYRNYDYEVRSWNKLSPRIENFQTIIWFPDELETPTAEAVDRIESWLTDSSDRTFIYVGRQFDAEELMWKKMLENAAPEQREKIERRLAQVQAENDGFLTQPINTREGKIYYDESVRYWRKANKLSGPWAGGIDAEKAEIWMYSPLLVPDQEGYDEAVADANTRTRSMWGYVEDVIEEDSDASGSSSKDKSDSTEDNKNNSSTDEQKPPPRIPDPSVEAPYEDFSTDNGPFDYDDDESYYGNDYYGYSPPAEPYIEILLETEDEIIAYRIVYDVYGGYGESQWIVICNGSFLLNGGLVNYENRKLAETVVNESTGYRVLFLESGPYPIEVTEIDTSERQNTPWDFMTIWPFSFIVPHMFLIAAIFYFAYYPIFGRPQKTEKSTDGDFGKHIAALGKLFSSTQDGNYMLDRIRHYNQHVKRESGQSDSNK